MFENLKNIETWTSMSMGKVVSKLCFYHEIVIFQTKSAWQNFNISIMNDMNNKTICGLYGIKTQITRDDLESLNIYIYIMNAMLFNIKNYACKVFVKIPPVTCFSPF